MVNLKNVMVKCESKYKTVDCQILCILSNLLITVCIRKYTWKHNRCVLEILQEARNLRCHFVPPALLLEELAFAMCKISNNLIAWPMKPRVVCSNYRGPGAITQQADLYIMIESVCHLDSTLTNNCASNLKLKIFLDGELECSNFLIS